MKVLIFACLVAYVSAHSCLVFPEQRGGYPNNALNTAGADACGLTSNPPCGGKAPEQFGQLFRAGSKINVTFTKNLDHYNKDAPGYWAINLWKGTASTNVLNISDPSTDKVGTGDFVTVPLDIPKSEARVGAEPEKYIVQLIYATNNPKVDKAMFYQCADIEVMSDSRRN